MVIKCIKFIFGNGRILSGFGYIAVGWIIAQKKILRRWTKGYTIKQPNMDCQPTEITALMRHRAVFSWAEEGGIPTSGA